MKRRKRTPQEIAAYLSGHEVGFRHGLQKAIEAAELAVRQICRGDFGLVGPAGIGMQIVKAISDWMPPSIPEAPPPPKSRRKKP